MSALFEAARLFPFWGLVVALTAVEVGVYFRRRKRAAKMGICFAIAAVFLGLVVGWFVARGDLHSDAWIRAWTDA